MDAAPRDGRELPEPFRHVPAEVVAGGVAELLTHVLGVDWTVSLLAPALTAVARTVWEADRRQWQQAAEAVKVAADELGGAALVQEQALVDPGRTELFRRVVQAAGRSTLQEKIPALGRVLAAGLPDGDTVDEALILAAALSDIEAPHLQVLTAIQDHPSPPVVAQYPDTGKTGWNTEQLAEWLPGTRPVLPALVQTLERHGLIHNLSAIDPTYADVGRVRYGVLPLGSHLILLLRDAG